MNVLVLGGNGYLGPHVVKALEPYHNLRITDVKPVEDTKHESFIVDVSSIDQVVKAAEGMDAIINCSVLREHRRIAFDVNALGCYSTMKAAVEHNIKRVINTGPFFAISGPTYENYDFMINEEITSHSGTNLYALTKSVGQEICRVFTENYDVYVMSFLFYNFRDPNNPDETKPGTDLTPFIVSWRDAGQAFYLGLEIDLNDLPSKNETFYISTDIPHSKFSNSKAKRILGFSPKDRFEQVWHKAIDSGQ